MLGDASTILLLAFIVSLGLTIVALFSGTTDLSLPGLNLDGDGGTDPGDLQGPSVFNLPTLLAFLTWFSGSAYLLVGLVGVPLLPALGVAAVVAAGGAGLVFFFLVRIVWPGQTAYLKSDEFDLIGQIGRLTTRVRPGGTGEMVYSQGGVRRVVTARSERGAPLNRGIEVVVVRYERGVAYVEAFEELLKDRDSQAAAS
jgi:hypothetical protein